MRQVQLTGRVDDGEGTAGVLDGPAWGEAYVTGTCSTIVSQNKSGVGLSGWLYMSTPPLGMICVVLYAAAHS